MLYGERVQTSPTSPSSTSLPLSGSTMRSSTPSCGLPARAQQPAPRPVRVVVLEAAATVMAPVVSVMP